MGTPVGDSSPNKDPGTSRFGLRDSGSYRKCLMTAPLRECDESRGTWYKQRLTAQIDADSERPEAPDMADVRTVIRSIVWGSWFV